MLSLLLLTLLPLSYSLPQYNNQQQFSNFPTYPELRDINEENDDFVEDAVQYEPQDRETRQVGINLPQLDDYYDDEPSQFDDVFDELDTGDDSARIERDGGHHDNSGRHGRQGRRGGRRNQQQLQQQDFEPVFDEPRGGRQTGGIAPALGVLNNPPAEDGSYNFNFVDDDGSTREESMSSDGFVQGSYSYITPEGEQIQVSYTADETGYHPSGLPPMPAHVQRLLDHLAKVNGRR